MSTVSLANAKQFSCTAESTLLDAAKTQGLTLEHSCRTGRCGICKAQVVHGKTHALKNEEALSSEEIQAGYVLTCCRAAVTDVALDIEDLGYLGSIKTQTLACKIDSIYKLAPDVLQIFLRLPPNNQFEYLSGQYIDVIAKNGIRRSYSIANAFQHLGKIELHIRQVNEGKMSHYWFNEAQVNDLLRFEGPQGTFCYRSNTLRNSTEKNIIFLATGTGIAPIKSILEALDNAAEHVNTKNIYIYWGGRTQQDIYWQPVFAKLNIHFRPTLSRAHSHWAGRSGYIQDAVIADKITLKESVVYACGSNTMIHSAQKRLLLHGLDKHNFYSDAFVSST
jgi:CDP-4-dehydro-6-deoxyglucose reductase, E3